MRSETWQVHLKETGPGGARCGSCEWRWALAVIPAWSFACQVVSTFLWVSSHLCKLGTRTYTFLTASLQGWKKPMFVCTYNYKPSTSNSYLGPRKYALLKAWSMHQLQRFCFCKRTSQGTQGLKRQRKEGEAEGSWQLKTRTCTDSLLATTRFGSPKQVQFCDW